MMRKVVFLVLALVTVWLLASCSRTDAPLPAEVRGEQRERPTTTSWVEQTTTTSWAAPDVTDDDDLIYSLIEQVPALAGLPTEAIRTNLLVAVCDEIDNAYGDFVDVGDAIVSASVGNFDFDYSDAGAIVATAVLTECPEWRVAAQEFANGGS
jgi:hypothetical protein